MRGLSKGNCRKVLAAFLGGLLLLGLSGCGAASSSGEKMAADSMMTQSSNGDFSYGTEAAIGAEAGMEEAVTEAASESFAQTDEGGGNLSAEAYLESRKLIRTVDMDVETREFDQVLKTLEDQVASLGGYIESMNTYNGSSYSSYQGTRNADMTARIPAERLDDFLNTVSEVSNVVRRSDNVEDVTLTYVDLESRRDALSTEQDRLLALMERAETVEDIITIESRLSEVRYELESMESQLRTYDNRVDYSTVYLNINEVEVLTPVEEEGVWERIGNGFMTSIKNIGRGFREFFVGFLINLPYLALTAVFVLLVIFIAVKCSKRQKKRSAQEKAQGSEEKHE